MTNKNYTPLRFTGDLLEKNVEVVRDGETEILKNYIPDPDLVSAVNLALLLEKPLLVMGEPGCGKSLLAKALAYDLYKENLYGLYREWHIKSTSKAKDGLYEFDNLHRLRDATLPNSAFDSNDIDKYIHFGPMGEAFRLSEDPYKRVVLLIDEIDKADIDFPNDLLNELDKMEFEIQEKKIEEREKIKTDKQTENADKLDGDRAVADKPGADKPEAVKSERTDAKSVESIPGKVKAKYRSIVIITSNSEKELPDAFLRRCIFHYIKPLEEIKLKKIIQGRYYDNETEDPLIQKALSLFLKLRTTIKDELLSVGKNVSTSEFIDWFEALKYYNDIKVEDKAYAQDVKTMVDELEKLDKNDLRQIPFYNILMKNINSVIRFNEQPVKQA